MASNKNTMIAAGAGVLLLAGGVTAAVALNGDDESDINGTVSATETVADETSVDDSATDTSAEETAAQETSTQGSPDGGSADDDSALAAAATVTEAEAEAAALAAEAGTVDYIALDEEDGFVVWEVEVRTAEGSMVDLLVDAGDASILEQEADRDDDDNDSDRDDIVGSIAVPADATPLEDLATVTQAQAEDAALAAAPGNVDSARLGTEDGFVIWDVEVAADDGTFVDFIIDAGDESILEQDVDNDRD